MTRSEQLSRKSFEEQEWQKLFNKYQQQYIRRRLVAMQILKTLDQIFALVPLSIP